MSGPTRTCLVCLLTVPLRSNEPLLTSLTVAGAQIFEDSKSISSYSYDSAKRELISYDTPNIVKQKAQYVIDQGLAGTMFWELSTDKVGADSLVAAAKSAIGGLDTTQNHIK